MEKWIATGVSGCGRIDLLKELCDCAKTIGKTIIIHDVAELIQQECQKNKVPFSDQRILDLDRNLLKFLRVAALKEANARILKQPDVDIHLIGVHAMFRWKNRLIPGISYSDLLEIRPDGFLNVVDDVRTIFSTNSMNPKWDKFTIPGIPGIKETMQWMQEEEFITELLADVLDKPMFLVARQHNPSNLADLFFTKKKKVYLSYPITAVRDENPELLKRIQGSILKELEKKFVVFNPLAIKDMLLTYKKAEQELPELTSQLTLEAQDIIKARTVERDYQFIDQADAIVVFYLTEKLSPGVLSEIFYAHRNQKPVFMAYSGTRSPFIEEATTCIENDIEPLMKRLDKFANQ